MRSIHDVMKQHKEAHRGVASVAVADPVSSVADDDYPDHRRVVIHAEDGPASLPRLAAATKTAELVDSDEGDYALRSSLVPRRAMMASQKLRMLAQDPSGETEPVCLEADAPLIAEGVLVNVLECLRGVLCENGLYGRAPVVVYC